MTKKYKAYVSQDWGIPSDYNPFDKENAASEIVRVYFYEGAESYFRVESTITKEELVALNREDYIVYELSSYEHSGVSFNVGGLIDKWDSSKVGFIVIKKDKTWFNDSLKFANSIINEFNDYYNGNYSFVRIVEVSICPCCGRETEEIIDSCGGIAYGSEEDYISEYVDNLNEVEIIYE